MNRCICFSSDSGSVHTAFIGLSKVLGSVRTYGFLVLPRFWAVCVCMCLRRFYCCCSVCRCCWFFQWFESKIWAPGSETAWGGARSRGFGTVWERPDQETKGKGRDMGRYHIYVRMYVYIYIYIRRYLCIYVFSRLLYVHTHTLSPVCACMA